MSLKTKNLAELNTLAKGVKKGSNTQEAFNEKLRTTIVDGSQDPNEYEPANTGALAWKEVGPRGRPGFDVAVLEILGTLGQLEKAEMIDFPFSHAVVKMVSNMALSGPESAILLETIREKLLVSLDKISVQNTHFEPCWRENYEQSAELWFESMLLAFELHTTQPSWLGMVWDLLLKEQEQSEKRTQFLEHCARICPEWITTEILQTHINISQYREAGLKRFIYLLACSLEDTAGGRKKLDDFVGKENASRQDSDLLLRAIIQS